MHTYKDNMHIRQLSTYELLDQYTQEVKRLHYDPCDSMELQEFSYGELLQELRRLDRYAALSS